MAVENPSLLTEADIPPQCKNCPSFASKKRRAEISAKYEVGDQLQKTIQDARDTIMDVGKRLTDELVEVGRLNGDEYIDEQRRAEMVAGWTEMLVPILAEHNRIFAIRENKDTVQGAILARNIHGIVEEMRVCQTGPLETRKIAKRPSSVYAHIDQRDRIVWEGEPTPECGLEIFPPTKVEAYWDGTHAEEISTLREQQHNAALVRQTQREHPIVGML